MRGPKGGNVECGGIRDPREHIQLSKRDQGGQYAEHKLHQTGPN